MIRIRFRNLKRSQLVREAIETKLRDDLERFPDLKSDDMEVTVTMENSPAQAGPDFFRVRLRILGGRYKGLILEKSGINFYVALGELNRNLVERLNRYGEKTRSVRRKRVRQQMAL